MCSTLHALLLAEKPCKNVKLHTAFGTKMGVIVVYAIGVILQLTPFVYLKEVIFVHAAIISVFTIVAVIITGDLTPLDSLIPSVFAELAAATGFYYNKAKAENQIKLRKHYGSEVYGESGAADM